MKEASLRNAAWFAKLTTHKHCSILENRTCLLWDVHILQHQSEKRNFDDYLEKCELPPSNVSGDVPFLLIHHLSKGLLAKIKVKRSSGSYAKDWLDQLFVFPCDMYTILMCRY